MIGLGITYSVTGGSSLHNFYSIVCEKNAMGECHSAGLSVWIIVFSALHLFLIQVSMPLHACCTSLCPLHQRSNPPLPPPPGPLSHAGCANSIMPTDDTLDVALVITSDITPGGLASAETIFTRCKLSLPLPNCVLTALLPHYTAQ